MTGAETGGLLDNRRLMGFAFLAPAVVYIALLIGVPFVTAFAYSLVHVWRMMPLATVILMAGLSNIPTDLSDQAKADGARYFRALFQVKLPLILPVMLNSLLFSFIFTFGDLAVVCKPALIVTPPRQF